MEEYEYKIIFVGDVGIGAKTSLIKKFIYNKFDKDFKLTISVNSTSIFILVNLGIIKLVLWDIIRAEKYRSISLQFFKGSHCIILGYDIIFKETFNEI